MSTGSFKKWTDMTDEERADWKTRSRGREMFRLFVSEKTVEGEGDIRFAGLYNLWRDEFYRACEIDEIGKDEIDAVETVSWDVGLHVVKRKMRIPVTDNETATGWTMLLGMDFR